MRRGVSRDVTEGFGGMEGRGLVGWRRGPGVLGRISGMLTDEEAGEITNVLVEPEDGGQVELPI